MFGEGRALGAIQTDALVPNMFEQTPLTSALIIRVKLKDRVFAKRSHNPRDSESVVCHFLGRRRLDHNAFHGKPTSSSSSQSQNYIKPPSSYLYGFPFPCFALAT